MGSVPEGVVSKSHVALQMASFHQTGQNRRGARRDGAGPLDAGVAGAEAGQEDHVGEAFAGVVGSRADALSGRLGAEALKAALAQSGEVFLAASAGGQTGIAACATGNGGGGGGAGKIGGGGGAGRNGGGGGGAASAAGAASSAAGASAVEKQRVGLVHPRGRFNPNFQAAGASGRSAEAAGAASQQRPPQPQPAVGSASAAPSAERHPVTGAGSLPEVDDRRRVLVIRLEKWTSGRQACKFPFEIGREISVNLDLFPAIPLPFVVGTSVRAFSQKLLNQAAPMLPDPSRFRIPDQSFLACVCQVAVLKRGPLYSSQAFCMIVEV